MPNLISRVVGLPEASSGRRPQMLEFQGINWNSSQADNLAAFFPMWEPPGAPCLDLGPLGLVGQPTNILRTQDPYFGDVYQGDGTARFYKVVNNTAAGGINFGVPAPRAFSVAFWAQVSPPPPTVDYYIFAFDNPASAFSGYTCSFDTSAQASFSTNNPTSTAVAAKTVFNPFDGRWHHYCFAHVPGTAGAANAQQFNYVDGLLDSQAPSGSLTPTATIGSFGPATLYFGIDDDGATGQFQGQFCDFRIYSTALGASDAAQIYHPDTRWELYQPARKSFYVPADVAAGAPAAVARRPTVVDQAVNRAAYW
jgi:hypothetical protein